MGKRCKVCSWVRWLHHYLQVGKLQDSIVAQQDKVAIPSPQIAKYFGFGEYPRFTHREGALCVVWFRTQVGGIVLSTLQPTQVPTPQQATGLGQQDASPCQHDAMPQVSRHECEMYSLRLMD